MRAMIIERTGGPEVLQLREVPTPEPGPGQALIRIACAGVNPADWKDRQGMLAIYQPYRFPYIVGFDAAGVVERVGAGVDGLRPGDRVFTPGNHGQGAWGSYAEYLVADADRVALIPPGMSFEAAAAIPVAALTGWQALFDRGGLKAGQRVLIHGGSGGLGSFAVQFARWAGAAVAATCGTSNLDYVRELGAQRAIDYRREDIAATVADWAPGGLDLLIDAVGASTLPDGLALVRPGGVFVSIPTLTDDGDIEASFAAAAARGVTRIFSTMTDKGCGVQLARIAGLVATSEVRLPPIRTLPLAQAADAHRLIQEGHTRGKLVLKVAEP
ncbi:quinone oxidoreductase [Denitratisoma sp. DHT3]|uniref:quinone oxidoreductase family protein n=1 Tax=Denitratisoma sp. DHT3 TaxID=1981880 RepID=UPI0011986494|nr:NADP-dependent oxidoreductase [Denitratisoma sp. DHT3]QDX82434.1 quinone oxidoreductase [Denitratisoma sp. DHT3]